MGENLKNSRYWDGRNILTQEEEIGQRKYIAAWAEKRYLVWYRRYDRWLRLHKFIDGYCPNSVLRSFVIAMENKCIEKQNYYNRIIRVNLHALKE